jgi:glycine betaine/proline transport system permease protein
MNDEAYTVPIGQWIEDFVDYTLVAHGESLDRVAAVIYWLTETIEELLLGPPPWASVAILVVLGFWRLGWRFAGFAVLAGALVINLGLWGLFMQTLALVLTATLVSLVVGIPLGIAAARSHKVELIIRPILDLMQTMPAFVYLIPAAMFFGLGKVPGVFATIIFSMPPAVRLTNIGIRQVSRELIEAGLAFGCTPWQLLVKIQIPTAIPSIMAGVNQTIMLALSMVVIASMIGSGGLGDEILKGIQRLDIGLGFEAGIAVVILAVLLDRLTQSFSRSSKTG